MMKPEFEMLRNMAMYNSLIWNFLSEEQKLGVCRQTLNLFMKNAINNGVEFVYQNQFVKIKNLNENDCNVKLDFRRMDRSLNGEYDAKTKTIIMNEDLLKTPGKLFYFLIHETTHSLQHAASHHRKEYDKNSIEYRMLSVFELNVSNYDYDYKIFGIDISGRLYVDPIIKGETSEQVQLRDALYNLIGTERSAFSTAERFAEILTKMGMRNTELSKYLKTESERYQNSIELIKQKYDCAFLSDQEIYNLIDDTQLHIWQAKMPIDDRMASLTYDIATILYLQNDVVDVDRYEQLLKIQTKIEKLNKDGFRIPETDLSYANFADMNKIRDLLIYEDLSDEEKIMNPELVVKAAIRTDDDLPKMIVDEPKFQEWFKSDSGVTSEKIQEIFASQVSQDYAPENVRKDREMRQQQKLQEKTRREERLSRIDSTQKERMIFGDLDREWKNNLVYNDGKTIKEHNQATQCFEQEEQEQDAGIERQ